VTLNFQTSDAGFDTLAPAIQGFSLYPSSFEPSQPGGAYLSAAIRFSDSLSGFYWGEVTFLATSSGQTRSFGFYDNLQGSTLAGTLYASEKLNPFTAAGSWFSTPLILKTKQATDFTKAAATPTGAPSSASAKSRKPPSRTPMSPIQLKGSGPDTLALTLQGFSLSSLSLDPSRPGGTYLSAAVRFSDNQALATAQDPGHRQ
jgi:hypothetical protein